MKKLIFILSILSILGCSKEEDDCKCDVKIVVVDTGGSYTITNVPSDCKGNIDINILNLPNNHWYSNAVNCD